MPAIALRMSLDAQRDDFLLWLRWVAMERPPTPEDPPGQGMRVAFLINRQRVLGPEIFSRAQVEPQGMWLPVPRCAWKPIVATSPAPRHLDLQLVIHGSVANAPYLALFHLRDEAMAQGPTPPEQAGLGTPLLQVQPSVPQGQWQVSGQANLRVALELLPPKGRLRVLSDP